MTRRSRITHSPPPEVREALTKLGRYIREARLSRGLRIQDVADRLGVSRFTMADVEKGKPGTSAGAYVGALWVLGLLERVLPISGDEHTPCLDAEGERLENSRAPARDGVRPG